VALLSGISVVSSFSYMYSILLAICIANLFYSVLIQFLCVHISYNSSIFCSIPNRCESFHKELDYVKQIWKNKQDLKIEDASIAVLFGLECHAWFCAGQIVGRGFTFTGYYV